MILFKEDWNKYPDAIRHYDTRNVSFARLARLYHEMGIKNSTFLLALMQPALQDVDPHDPNISAADKVRVITECQYNPWYFFREVFRVPQDGGVVVPFKAHRGNIAMIWSFMNHIDYAGIQPRQTGKSLGADSIYTYGLTTRDKMKINLITKDDKLRVDNVTRIKSYIDELPEWFAPRTKEDSNNQEEVTVAVRGSKLKTHLARADRKAANNVCRGDTAPVLGTDEGPFCVNIQISLPAAWGSGTEARIQAEARDGLYANLYTTTAGSLDDPEGRFMHLLISGGTPWNEIFLDSTNLENLKELLRKNCAGNKLIINGTFSHIQLGLSDEWMRMALENASPITPEQADKDFFNVWRSGKASNPINVDVLKRITASEQDPIYNEITASGIIIRWYLSKQEIDLQVSGDRKWIMGLDTSNAINRDAIAGIIIDAITGKLVGAFTCNQDNLITFATGFLCSIMRRYPNIVIIPENKSSGPTMIDALLLSLPDKGEDPFKRIFNYYVQDSDSKFRDEYRDIIKTNHRDEKWYIDRKKHFGFMTDGSRREQLYSVVLQSSARMTCDSIRDRKLSQELKELTEKKGRIDHASSGNDDHVVAWLLAHWLRSHGKNLEHYGIRGIETEQEIDNKDPDKVYARAYSQGIKTQIDRCVELLKMEDNEDRIMMLENKIKSLGYLAGDYSESSSTMDELINRTRKERQDRINSKARNPFTQMTGDRLFSRRTNNYY